MDSGGGAIPGAAVVVKQRCGRNFAPDIKIAAARSWTVSFQRAITKDMAVDIRYVGSKARGEKRNGFYPRQCGRWELCSWEFVSEA